jgi:putative DNA primase/helicase
MINGHHPNYVRAAIEGESAIVASAQEGARNAILFKSTAALASLGVPEQEILAHLRPAAEQTGLHGREIDVTVRSGTRAGQANPRVVQAKNPMRRADTLKPAKAASVLRRSKPGPNRQRPAFKAGGDAGPPTSDGELRRHYYCANGRPVRVKIKFEDRYSNWYRVLDGCVDGWQAAKPAEYEACPYFGGFDPFDTEYRNDALYWPEGEKDCDTLSAHGLLAFTFGGTGDGLPDGVIRFLADRHIVILADNDTGGRDHALKKAALAHSVATSVKVVEFSELPEKGDVSDYLAGAAVEEFEERVRRVPLWKPAPPIENRTGQDRTLVTCSLSDIVPEKVDWLWPGRIARGKLTLLAGEPGLGKSQVTIYVASTVTRGELWVGSKERARRGRVLILSAEDGLADTVRPRFDAAGGDPSLVSVIRAVAAANGSTRGMVNLATDLALIEREIHRFGDVDLVIIDPVSSYLPNIDSHKNTDVRSVLEPIGEMAERLKVAILATTHLSKANGKAINRIIGSIAFVAAARTAFTVVEDPDEEGRRLLLQIKNNIAPAQPGLAFRLEQREIAPSVIGSAVMWDETVSVSVTADEALAGVTNQSSAKQDAVEFLRDLLCDGPMAVRDIEGHAVEAAMLADGKPIGQAKPFRLARQVLGIKPRRSGGLGGEGSWLWELPEAAKVPSASYDALVREEGILTTGGHLSAEGGKP